MGVYKGSRISIDWMVVVVFRFERKWNIRGTFQEKLIVVILCSLLRQFEILCVGEPPVALLIPSHHAALYIN